MVIARDILWRRRIIAHRSDQAHAWPLVDRPGDQPGQPILRHNSIVIQEHQVTPACLCQCLVAASRKAAVSLVGDNDDPRRPPAANVFLNRTRLITDDNGYYEFETIHPGPYRIDQKTWRPSHIHYWIRRTGYRELVTQLYFRGDEHQKTDAWIKQSLIIDLREQRRNNVVYKTGTFDIVLAPRPRKP